MILRLARALTQVAVARWDALPVCAGAARGGRDPYSERLRSMAHAQREQAGLLEQWLGGLHAVYRDTSRRSGVTVPVAARPGWMVLWVA